MPSSPFHTRHTPVPLSLPTNPNTPRPASTALPTLSLTPRPPQRSSLYSPSPAPLPPPFVIPPRLTHHTHASTQTLESSPPPQGANLTPHEPSGDIPLAWHGLIRKALSLRPSRGRRKSPIPPPRRWEDILALYNRSDVMKPIAKASTRSRPRTPAPPPILQTVTQTPTRGVQLAGVSPEDIPNWLASRPLYRSLRSNVALTDDNFLLLTDLPGAVSTVERVTQENNWVRLARQQRGGSRRT